MNNYFYGEITVTNDITGKIISPKDILFTVEGSSITLSFSDSLIVTTSDLDNEGNPISYQIFHKFDREILWDFGDGTTIKGLNASHSYKQPGTYSITCTCFDINGIPYQNNFPKATQAVVVKDILNTATVFSDEYLLKVKNGLLTNIFAGQTVEVGEILVTLDKAIEKNVPIKTFVTNSNCTNIFDSTLKTPFQHLLPYNTFLTPENEPALSFMPNYKDVFVSFLVENDDIILDFYILDLNLSDISEKIPIILNADIPYTYRTNYINSLDNIQDIKSFYTGKTGIVSIFYKDDLPSKNVNIFFALDQDYFPDSNILISKNIINTVSIGTSLEIKKNKLTGNEIIFYSTNGLTTAKNTIDSPLYDLSLTNNNFSFDRAKYCGVESPFIIRIISNKENPYFIKDLILSDVKVNSIFPLNSSLVTIYNTFTTETNELYTNLGSCFCSIIPGNETDNNLGSVTLEFLLEDYDNTSLKYELNINNLTYINFESFKNKDSKFYLNPEQNYIDYSAEEAWDVYKTHPLFEDIPILDNYMISILKNSNLLQNIINKGWNFVDDIGNINTCSIKNLISILDSIDLKIDLYNNENFSKPDIINQLLKIFSISHSRLIGTTLKIEDEFETFDNLPGKNRGELIPLSEKIYIPITDGKYQWPKLVCYDRFDKSYRVLNTALLEYVPDSPIKTDINGKYFQIIDYFKGWGWGLLLGDLEYYNYYPLSPNKNDRLIFSLLTKGASLIKAEEQINKFYQFYHYINTDIYKVENSYLKPDTISDNVKDYNLWYKADGSIDRLLYKTLIENLNLNV